MLLPGFYSRGSTHLEHPPQVHIAGLRRYIHLRVEQPVPRHAVDGE